MPNFLKRALTAALLSLSTSVHAHAGQITIEEPFARAPAASSQVAGVFMTVRNSGTTADALIGVETPIAARAELHTHVMDGDIMRMRQVEAIDLPSGEIVRLQPGGLHVMLIGLQRPLRQGEAFPLTLSFAKAEKMTIEVPVKSPAEMPPMPSHQH